jgi:hypothetical protein
MNKLEIASIFVYVGVNFYDRRQVVFKSIGI